MLVTAADHVVDPADLAALSGELEGSGAAMAVGLVPAAADPYRLHLQGPGGGRVVRDPDGRWESAGVYAIRAGRLCDLEPGPATLFGRVLGPLLEQGQVAGLPFRGPMADAGTLARLLEVSAGLLAGRWPYALPPGELRRGGPPDPLQAPELGQQLASRDRTHPGKIEQG